MDPGDRIIVALDVATADSASALVERLSPHVRTFKIGLELVHSAGFDVFRRLEDAGARRIFYDAKLHDIPNTVAGALRQIARLRLWMVNVHALGGSRMVAAGAAALLEGAHGSGHAPPRLIAVTMLTSLSQEDLRGELHVAMTSTDYAVALARMAQDAGAQGVVASPHEVAAIRAACGNDFLLVTPGVRPSGSQMSDQRRVMTPGDAVREGADYLVIGRPITAAPDPVAAAQAIADELAGP